MSQALAQAAVALAAAAKALSRQTPVNIAVTHTLSPAPAPSAVTLTELINEFLRAKARANKSDRYLRALKNSLSKFHAGRGRLPISEIHFGMIQAWLEKSEWAPRTQQGYLGDLSTLFNFAVRRGYLRENPTAGVERVESVPKAPALHTPAQVRAALEYARKHDQNLCRALAIRYFAGVRSIEVCRMIEGEIKPEHIEVPAAKAKTRARRLVKIEPVLAAWLKLGGSVEFGDTGNRWRLFNAAVKAELGISWPYNVARHSFISYHVAMWENAGRTAYQAGTSEEKVFSNYRELVTKDQAAEFWSIYP